MEITTSKPLQWWGYRHKNGTISIKRYFDFADIKEALRSDFVEAVSGPIEAENREKATEFLKKWLAKT